ncbi:MAG TPA: protein kinase, partial [Blastocatellia bacterium]|nr:protein kinase [Blastocatellia bacterium]
MTPELYEKACHLYDTALEIDEQARTAFLEEACGGDEELRREVESLLAAHEEVGEYFASPALDVAAGLITQRQNLSLMGQSVSHYRVLSLIGAGGMGEVYLAEDTRLGRRVALKVLPKEFAEDRERVQRFEQEARAASALNHPNIITIHEVGQVEDAPFIITEFIEGQTLRQQMAAEKMRLREVLDVAIQVAGALEAAHEARIVHRDIKPENIMVRRDGLVKVVDFGLAKLSEDRDRRAGLDATTDVDTTPGLVLGTVSYMSPEQARGEKLDERTDIFSLGVVIYEMLAGRSPFAASSGAATLAAILEREPKPIGEYVEGVPVEVEQIVVKALRKQREGRYQRAREMLSDLREVRQEIEINSKLKRNGSQEKRGGETVVEASRVSDEQAAVDTDSKLAQRTDGAIARRGSSGEQIVTGTNRHKRWVAMAGMAVLIAVAALAYYIYPTSGGEAIDSVAVLPFENVSGNPDTEYLTDGISDSITNSLSRLPNLKVKSFNAALQYKGKQVDPQAVGRELKVKAVLMGRMTQQGEMLSISTELVDVRDSRHLWGEQYNRKLSDILVVQREIAQQISSALRLRLSGKEKKRIAKQYTENPDAQLAYHWGSYFLHKRRSQYIPKGIEHLEEAIRLDPNYALAHATLANAYLSRSLLGPLQLEEVLPRAKEAVGKALAIDDTLAEAHAVLGGIRFHEWDWSGAEREFKRAIELNPNYKPSSPNYEQYLVKMKRYDEAVAESKRVLELDPVSPYYNRNVGMILYFARRYDEAIEQIQKTLELEPEWGVAYNWLWRAYEQKGQYDQAVEAFLKFYGPINQQGPEAAAALREVYARSGWNGFWLKVLDLHMEQAKRGRNLHGLAENYARLGERDQALFWLEKAIEQRDV